MPKVAVIEFDRKKKASFLADMDLASIPTKEDKIVLNIEGIGYIFIVVDVHYADSQMVDVNVMRISTITDYNANRSLGEISGFK
jgi:hypothetical protein